MRSLNIQAGIQRDSRSADGPWPNSGTDVIERRRAVLAYLRGEYVFSAQTKSGLGARDLSRRNVGNADPRWEVSKPIRYATFLRTKVRAPFAPAATTLHRYKGEGREGEPSVAHPTVHSVNALRSAARLCAILVLLLATGMIGRAQSTNAVARLDYQSFKIITDRNIFDPNRSSRSSRRTEEPRPARVESFALVGTMSYENGTYAFFDGTGSSFRKAVKTGDTIAGYKVVDISGDRVKLEANGQQIELNVGVQMRKQDEGEWQLAGRADSFGTSSPATATAEKTDSASSGEESDVLKKLMQKREQELK